MKRTFSLLIFFISLTVFATDNIRFIHLSMKDGLSDSQVNHITRDSQGFIWISTAHGISRYDGYTFKNFTRDSNDPRSLPFYSVENIQEDGDGVLWVNFGESRYFCYDPRKEIFFDASTILSDRYGIDGKLSLVYIDSRKDLWIETLENGFYHYDSTGRKLHTITDKNTPDHLTCIDEDNNGVVRLYSNGYFDHVNRNNNKVDSRNGFLKAMTPKADNKYGVFCDNDGDYWIYSTRNAWIYYTHDDKWVDLTATTPPTNKLSGNNVRDIISDKNGKIWIAIDNGGINIIDKKSLNVEYISNNVADEKSLSQNSITCLYADTEGGIWVGTFKKGISYYNESLFKFRTDRFLTFNNVENFNPDVGSITEDLETNLWMGVPNGLIKVDRKTKKRELLKLPPVNSNHSINNVVVNMITSNDGNIWMGTYNNGLMSYDGKTFRHHQLDNNDRLSIANRSVWSIAQEKNGYLWVGTWGAGLYGFDPESGRATAYRDNEGLFNHDQIASICISRDKNIYMGTTYGLLIFNPMSGKFEKLLGNRKRSTLFSSSQIVQVYEDSRGLLWICTREGLNIYDRRNDEIIMPVTELSQTIIHGIIEDNDKNMWVTTTKGIFHIVVNGDPNARNYTFSNKNYNDLCLLDNFGFNPRAMLKHSSGTIVVGNISGINLIDPQNLKYDMANPQIRFTGIQLFNRDVKIDSVYDGCRILDKSPAYADRIQLNHDQNVFSVTFSSMKYVLPEKTKYMYMLEGFDADWTISNSNKLTYTNLAPGKYTLKIKAVNIDGYASDQTAELKIIIAPPFYRSWPAYIVYCILFVCAIFFVKTYMRHNEKQKYKLMQIQQDAKQKHEIDDMKLRFFTNISHDIRTPLTLILTPLEYVINHIDNPDLKDKLEMARKNAMRLLGMVNQLLDFRKSDMKGHNLNSIRGDIVYTIHTICNNFIEYSEHRNINLTFFSSTKSLCMMFDEDKINKIMMNLLSNAFKFTPEGGRVDVSLELSTSREGTDILEIRVADNGYGISDEHKQLIFDRFYQVPRKDGKPSTGSGVGLNLVKEFVTLHKGSIEVCDNVGKGAVFIVKIPVQHCDENITDKDLVTDDHQEKYQHPCVTVEQTSECDNNAKRPTVLIVDDNDDFRSFMKDCLKSDYTILEAPDGAKAWEMIPECQPDIIVSDVMMPEMDGNELCRMIKTDIRTSHILVILLTARAAKEHELKGLESGADDYITKPFNLSILTHRIKNLLQHRRDQHKQPMEISPSKINVTPLDEKLMQKAIRYVEDNLSRSDLSVEELSSELGMSRVHLYKKMVSITGKTPIEFIRIIRLKRAAQLLAESQLSIAEITYQTGFNNLNLFRKYFKNEFGLLPSEYQSKHGKKYNESI